MGALRYFWLMALSAVLAASTLAETPDGPQSPPKGYKLLATGPFDFAKDFSEGLAAVKADGKWGFIDTKGKMVIEPQFNPKQAQFNSQFSDGLVAVNFNVGPDNGLGGNDPPNTKWGFADKNGRIVINPNFEGYYYQPPSFHEGLAAMTVGPYGMDAISSERIFAKYGFIDKSGKFVIEPRFDKAYEFSSGLAAVQVNNKWGFIDQAGKFAIEPIYDAAYRFFEGLSAVTLDKKEFFIDRHGNRVGNQDYANLSQLSDGMASFVVDGKTGFIDRTGKVVIQPQFSSAGLFGIGNYSEDLCRVEFGNAGSGDAMKDWFSGRFGYINKKGSIVVNPRFGFSGDFKNGIARVDLDNKYGYIDKSGKFVIPPQFTSAGDFQDGVALVQFTKFGKYFFIKRVQPNTL